MPKNKQPLFTSESVVCAEYAQVLAVASYPTESNNHSSCNIRLFDMSADTLPSQFVFLGELEGMKNLRALLDKVIAFQEALEKNDKA